MNRKIILYLLLTVFLYKPYISHAQYCIDLNKTTFTQPECECTFTYGSIPFKAFWAPNGFNNDTVICTTVGKAGNPPWCGGIAFYKTDLPNYADIDSIRIYQDGPRDFFPFAIHANVGSVLGSSSFVANSDSLQRFYVTGWTIEDFFFINSAEPLIKVDIKYKNGNANNCSNQDIINVENILANPGVRLREDYHEYWDEAVICKNCSVDEVWSFMKTKRFYQVPTYDDFPASTGSLCLPDINIPEFDTKRLPLLSIQAALWSYRNSVISAQHSVTPLDVPITNCDDVQLAPTPLRVLGGMIVQVASLSSIQLVPPTSTCDVSLADEPVKVVIEEKEKRMTNYTLKGHFLYPGKVERYLVKDGCSGEVKVITHGIGVTTCGDNWAGAWIAYLNVCTGKHTFKNVSQRLAYDFNHK